MTRSESKQSNPKKLASSLTKIAKEVQDETNDNSENELLSKPLEKEGSLVSQDALDNAPQSTLHTEGDNDDEEQSEVDTSDSKECKLFLRAVYKADMKKIRKLLSEEDIHVNIADQHGWTALHWSCSKGYVDLVSFFLEKGAKVNVGDLIVGWSPLHLAVIRASVPIIKLLLDFGAKKDLVDKFGDKPIDCLRPGKGRRKLEIASLLKEEVEVKSDNQNGDQQEDSYSSFSEDN